MNFKKKNIQKKKLIVFETFIAEIIYSDVK